MSDKKQILIIGGSSFVAKNFIRLHQEDYDIKTISRSKTGFTNEVCYSDFFNIGEEEFKGVSIVINCAAIVHQQKKIADKVYNNINFELAIKLAEKAKKSNVKTFIKLYFARLWLPWNHHPSNPLNPL